MAPWPTLLFLLLATLVALSSGEEDEEDPKAGTPKFRTEPRFYPENFTILYRTNDPSALSPGYLFIAPIAKFYDWGPQIYDTDGNLVFYGDDLPDSGIQKHIEDFKVCDYLGEKGTHLCLHDGRKRGILAGPRPYGRKAFFDHTYKQVSMNYTYPDELNHTYPNSHEFRPVDDGYTFLEPIYVPRPMDLTPYLGLKKGAVWDACFTEINTKTGEPNFNWCYMDWYEVWQSNLFFEAEGSPNITSEKAGAGDPDWPWDAFHINAIDKNTEGDYLVSIRHLDQILKIAGNNNCKGLAPGTTIWRLGGKLNDFDMGQLMFSKQHSVRALSLSSTEETFSIFDNAWEGTNKPSARYSAGKVITIDNTTMVARSIREFRHPKGRITPSQGNMQDLANGNTLIGWGALPHITEFREDGAVLWHASFDKDDQRMGFTYRSFKNPWVGKPYWNPKLLAYSPSCTTSSTSPLIAYVSWNGATEVRQWHFFTATLPEGPWIPAGTFKKDGFETKAVLSGRLSSALSSFMPYVSVAALDEYGHVLGIANATTFVPKSNAPVDCDNDGCSLGFTYEERYSCADICHKSLLPAIVAFVLVVIILETLSYITSGLEIWIVNAQSSDSEIEEKNGPLKPELAKVVGYHQAGYIERFQPETRPATAADSLRASSIDERLVGIWVEGISKTNDGIGPR